MLKKIFVIIFSTILLCGCSNKNSAEKTITFSTWGSTTEIKILKNIISDFEKENPNIKISLLYFPQNYFQKIHLLFASNTEPDVIFINNLYLPIYSDFLEDLDSCINKKDFYESAIEAMSYDKKLLAIPRDISMLLFYVNNEIIDLPESSWKIEDLISIAKKINKKDFYPISFEEDIYYTMPYLAYFTEVDLTNGISEDEKKAIEFYLALRDKHQLAPSKSEIGSSTLAQMFLDKKIAFYLSGHWMFPKIKEKADFKWSVINFPYGKSKQSIDSSGWAVSKNSKNKEEAIQFVKYLSNEKNSKYFTESGLIVPARIKTAELLNNNEHNEKAFIEALKYTTKTIVDKNYKKTIDSTNEILRFQSK